MRYLLSWTLAPGFVFLLATGCSASQRDRAVRLQTENAVLRQLCKGAPIHLDRFPSFVVEAPNKDWVSYLLFRTRNRASMHATSCLAEAPGYELSDMRVTVNRLEAFGVRRHGSTGAMPKFARVVVIAERYNGVRKLDGVWVPSFAGRAEIRAARERKKPQR